MSSYFIINQLSSTIQVAFSAYQTQVFLVLYQVSVKRSGLQYKRPWRLDPIDAIIDGISDYAFQRLYRVSTQFFMTIYDYLLPFYENEYVFNNSGVGGRPRISFGLRLESFLFYIGRDTDLFASLDVRHSREFFK